MLAKRVSVKQIELIIQLRDLCFAESCALSNGVKCEIYFLFMHQIQFNFAEYNYLP